MARNAEQSDAENRAIASCVKSKVFMGAVSDPKRSASSVYRASGAEEVASLVVLSVVSAEVALPSAVIDVVEHGRFVAQRVMFSAAFLGVAYSIYATAVCSFARGQSANKRLERNSRQRLGFRLVVLHIIVSGLRAAVAHPQR